MEDFKRIKFAYIDYEFDGSFDGHFEIVGLIDMDWDNLLRHIDNGLFSLSSDGTIDIYSASKRAIFEAAKVISKIMLNHYSI